MSCWIPTNTTLRPNCLASMLALFHGLLPLICVLQPFSLHLHMAFFRRTLTRFASVVRQGSLSIHDSFQNTDYSKSSIKILYSTIVTENTIFYCGCWVIFTLRDKITLQHFLEPRTKGTHGGEQLVCLSRESWCSTVVLIYAIRYWNWASMIFVSSEKETMQNKNKKANSMCNLIF